jgi:hypothetical protein
MYEKLDKLRAEVRRSERRLADAQNKLKVAQEKLREGEASQILSDVGALKLTPEQLAQVLSLVRSGQLGTEIGLKTDSADSDLDGGQSSEDQATDGDRDAADHGNVGGSNWSETTYGDADSFDEDDAYESRSDRSNLD